MFLPSSLVQSLGPNAFRLVLSSFFDGLLLLDPLGGGRFQFLSTYFCGKCFLLLLSLKELTS